MFETQVLLGLPAFQLDDTFVVIACRNNSETARFDPKRLLNGLLRQLGDRG